MTSHEWDRVEALLERWQAARGSEHPLTPAELCADTPNLLPEVRRRVAAMELVLRYDTDSPADSLANQSQDTRPHQTPTSPAPPPYKPGDQFDNLTLVARLGRGGMGEVWAADDALRRRVAVKFLRSDLAADPISLRRFAREAVAHAAVEHDNVVPIYSVGEHAGRPYLVLPLLDGETLSARLKRGPLALDDLLRLGREVARGLAATHARRLIHRDVKPGNVWLDAAGGRARLLDFGLARNTDGSVDGEPITRSGAILGTPAYMAPEQADGRAVDHRADLFSLGVLLYQSATGVNPFAAITVLATLSALANITPAPPSSLRPDLPPGFDALVMGLLAKDADARTPATADAIADALATIEAGDAHAPPAIPRPRRKVRRWLPLAAVGVALPLLAWGVWAVWPKPVPAAVLTADDRVRELAASFDRQSLNLTITDETKNGIMGNPRVNEHTFRGKTGTPLWSKTEDGLTVFKVQYSGRYDRVSWMPAMPRNLQPPVTETQTVRGVVRFFLATAADGVRVTDYELAETGGDVFDFNHNAHKTAKAAVVALVREKLK